MGEREVPVGYNRVVRMRAITQASKGQTVGDIAEAEGISVATVRRWVRQARLHKDYVGKPAGRPRQSKLDKHLVFIRQLLSRRSDNRDFWTEECTPKADGHSRRTVNSVGFLREARA